MAETISNEESFENALHNFLQWLEVMTMQPIELCNAWGNYNVAWELVSDLKADGGAALSASGSYLTDAQEREICRFLESLDKIPKSILVSATSVSANQEAMSNSCWVPLRNDAALLLAILESAAARNRAYFSSQ